MIFHHIHTALQVMWLCPHVKSCLWAYVMFFHHIHTAIQVMCLLSMSQSQVMYLSPQVSLSVPRFSIKTFILHVIYL